jgi:hypothetical protein
MISDSLIQTTEQTPRERTGMRLKKQVTCRLALRQQISTCVPSKGRALRISNIQFQAAAQLGVASILGARLDCRSGEVRF